MIDEDIAPGERTPPHGDRARRIEPTGGTPTKTSARGRQTGAGRRAAKKAAAAAAAAAPLSNGQTATSLWLDGEGHGARATTPPPKPSKNEPKTPTSEDATTAAQPDSPVRPPENAVTARLVKTKMCYFFERGKCASANCRYAHSKAELRHQPNLQKTKLCKLWVQNSSCASGSNCPFAHGEGELKHTDGIYKTQMCHFYERGKCLKGDRCNHAHGETDLRIPPQSRQVLAQNTAAAAAAAQAQAQAQAQAAQSPAAAPQPGAVAGLQLSDMLDPAKQTQAMAQNVQNAAIQASLQSMALAGAAAALSGLFQDPLLAASAASAASQLWMPPWALGGYPTAATAAGIGVPGLAGMQAPVQYSPSPEEIAAATAAVAAGVAAGTPGFAVPAAAWNQAPPGTGAPVGGEAQPGALWELTQDMKKLDMVMKGFKMDVSNLEKKKAQETAAQKLHRI